MMSVRFSAGAATSPEAPNTPFVRATHAKPPVTPHEGRNRRNFNLVILANHTTRQINFQMTVAIRANNRPVIDGLVRVLMQGTAMTFVSRLRTAGPGLRTAGFPVSRRWL